MPSVPSPPIAINASIPRMSRFARASPIGISGKLTFPLTILTKLPRFLVPRMVPPRGNMPLTLFGVSLTVWVWPRMPSKLSSMPIQLIPNSPTAVLTTARIAALSPGASPPPVKIPICLYIKRVREVKLYFTSRTRKSERRRYLARTRPAISTRCVA